MCKELIFSIFLPQNVREIYIKLHLMFLINQLNTLIKNKSNQMCTSDFDIFSLSSPSAQLQQLTADTDVRRR